MREEAEEALCRYWNETREGGFISRTRLMGFLMGFARGLMESSDDEKWDTLDDIFMLMDIAQMKALGMEEEGYVTH